MKESPKERNGSFIFAFSFDNTNLGILLRAGKIIRKFPSQFQDWLEKGINGG